MIQLEQVTHDLKSIQVGDEEASKYFINYISDDSDNFDENNKKNIYNDNNSNNSESDMSSLPNNLIITSVPPDLFTDQQMKVKTIS